MRSAPAASTQLGAARPAKISNSVEISGAA
jgi:hypothetical protein